MKIHFAYYNQYKNGIDIAFADNTLLFLSCAEAEKNLHTTPNSQRLIDNLAIDNPLMMLHLLSIASCRHGLMLWIQTGIPIKLLYNHLFFECRIIGKFQ